MIGHSAFQCLYYSLEIFVASTLEKIFIYLERKRNTEGLMEEQCICIISDNEQGKLLRKNNLEAFHYVL